MYVLKMKKHEKHAQKSVVKIVHMIIKLDEWLNYVYESCGRSDIDLYQGAIDALSTK